MKILVASMTVSALLFGGAASAAVASTAAHAASASSKVTTAKGPTGQVLTANIVRGVLPVNKTTTVTITGKGYNTELGIYVTFCVIPAKGKRPELCGPFDITGANNQSVWVSSNPPIYAQLLVKPFGKNGTFKVTMPIDKTIGDNIDCTVERCAILTRADHTNSDNRTADVIIPVTFK